MCVCVCIMHFIPIYYIYTTIPSYAIDDLFNGIWTQFSGDQPFAKITTYMHLAF